MIWASIFSLFSHPSLGNTGKPTSTNGSSEMRNLDPAITKLQQMPARMNETASEQQDNECPLVRKLHDEGSRVGCMSFMAREWTCDSQLLFLAAVKNNMPDVSGGFQTSFWTTCQRNAAGWPRSFSVFFWKLPVLHLVSIVIPKCHQSPVCSWAVATS